MVVLANRVKVPVASAPGTQDITLSTTAEAGYQNFSDGGISNGDTVRFVVEDGDAWEISTGTYTSSTNVLTRTLTESSTGSLLDLSADAIVFITAAADDIVPSSGGTFSGNVDLGDNVRIRLGDSDDLQIYHDGSNSYVSDTGTGALHLKSTGGGVKVVDSSNAVKFTVAVGTGNVSVTGTVDGRDIAADGTKLDGIESGATADQTASEILTAIKTVDGASSGLDADLLDGQEGSYYTNAANLTGTIPDVFNVSTRYNIGLIDGSSSQTRDKLRVWNSSYYTIGMQSGYTFGALNDYAMSFQMNDDADRGFWWGDTGHTNAQGAMSLTTNGHLTVANSVRIGYGESNTSGAAYDLDVSGTAYFSGSINVNTIYAAGQVDTYLAFGNDILTLVAGGRQILRMDEGTNPDRLRFVTDSNWTDSSGDWNMSGDVTIGGNVSATQYTATSDITLKENLLDIDGALQKIAQINGYTYNFIKTPEFRNAGLVAQEVEKVVPEAVTENSEGIKSIDYNGVIALLVSAIKEQQAEIDLLKEKIGA